MREVRRLGNVYGDQYGESFAGNVWDKNGLVPSIMTMQGGGRQPMIVEDFYENREPRVYKDYAPALRAEREGLKVIEDTDMKDTEKVDLGDGEIICSKTKDGGAIVNTGKDGVSITVKAQYYKTSLANFARPGASYAATGIVEKNPEYIEVAQATKDGSIKCKVGGCYNSNYPDSKTRRGRVQEDGDVTPTLTVADIEKINYVETKYRIRKLTPKECWRLMGYTDEDFDKASASGVSNSQLYKQAGNAIVKQVLMGIFAQMIPQSARSGS
jgi:DNA (cytosine-5)-methyltransferase 1